MGKNGSGGVKEKGRALARKCLTYTVICVIYMPLFSLQDSRFSTACQTFIAFVVNQATEKITCGPIEYNVGEKYIQAEKYIVRDREPG